MNKRSGEKEELDDLSLCGEPLESALKSLEWVNRRLGNHRQTLRSILKQVPDKYPVKIIDLGCGGGDLILAIARALEKKGTPYSISGIDGNEHTLAYARNQCSGYPAIQFRKDDILHPQFKTGSCDILVCSHFIYHFSEPALMDFLGSNLPSIGTAFICSELERNRLAAWLFRIFGIFMPISKPAWCDGLIAIQRSFTKNEWLQLLKKAGITHFTLKRTPFFRLQLLIPFNYR